MINILYAISICLCCSNALSMNLMTEQQLDAFVKSQKWPIYESDYDFDYSKQLYDEISLKTSKPFKEWDDDLIELYMVACCGSRERGFRTYFENCMEKFCQHYEVDMFGKTEQMCTEQDIDFKVLLKNLLDDLAVTRFAGALWRMGENKAEEGKKEEAILYFKKAAFAYLIYIQKNPNVEEHLGIVQLSWRDLLRE